MQPSDYSEEQRKSIESRVEKAKESLKSLHLKPAVIMQSVNLGDDVFGMQPIPYLQDVLFTKSPIQGKDL